MAAAEAATAQAETEAVKQWQWRQQLCKRLFPLVSLVDGIWAHVLTLNGTRKIVFAAAVSHGFRTNEQESAHLSP